MKRKDYFRIQFGDVIFYKFLKKIGLMPKKSKVIKSIRTPNQYFFDFLRGHFDGDGTFYSYWDPRWKSSFMFYTAFISASFYHIHWLQRKIYRFLRIKGHIAQDSKKMAYYLKYAKTDSLKLIPKMYYSKNVPSLQRKRLKIERVLGINTKV